MSEIATNRNSCKSNFKNYQVIQKDNISDRSICTCDHPVSAYAKFLKKLTFFAHWYAHVRAFFRTYQNESSPLLVFKPPNQIWNLLRAMLYQFYTCPKCKVLSLKANFSLVPAFLKSAMPGSKGGVYMRAQAIVAKIPIQIARYISEC